MMHQANANLNEIVIIVREYTKRNDIDYCNPSPRERAETTDSRMA